MPIASALKEDGIIREAQFGVGMGLEKQKWKDIWVYGTNEKDVEHDSVW